MAEMNELEIVRELVVEAMVELEQALIDGQPAQAPASGKREIALSLAALRERIENAVRKIEKAESLLSAVR